MQWATNLSKANSHDPSVERCLIFGTQELYIFAGLGLLQSWMLDRKAEVCWGLEFLTPPHTIIHLLSTNILSPIQQYYGYIQCSVI